MGRMSAALVLDSRSCANQGFTGGYHGFCACLFLKVRFQTDIAGRRTVFLCYLLATPARVSIDGSICLFHDG